ncbi:MAG: PhzF family phenazine biosynthesis protein [Polyangiaceae bacterium]
MDAFADTPFFGEPGGGFYIAAGGWDEQWMQLVAREMNLSETAFLRRDEGFLLRWFTPAVVDLCGHATLANAHVLWEDKHAPERGERIGFIRRAGS